MNKVNVVSDVDSLRALGQKLAEELSGGDVVFLSGPLGAGKTTLVQGILQGLGYSGYAKSPTYGLVESYDFEAVGVHHFDCYRLESPEAIHAIGLSDYLDSDAICLIEWPEKALSCLPDPTISCTIEVRGEGRCVSFS